MSGTTIRLVMGQMLVEGGRPEENLDRAACMIRQAGEMGRSLVVLPECLDLGWTHPSAKEWAEPIPGPRSARLARIAAEVGVCVVAGLTERAADRIYNAAVLIAADGELLATHRKINLLDIEQEFYAIGDRLQVVRTPLGVIGLNICADNFPDSLALGHSLARMGAEILLSPSAWAVDADYDPQREPYGSLWEDAYRPLASLYEMPIVGVSNVGPITGGPWRGRKCIGCSLAVGRQGQILAKAPYGDDAQGLFPVDVERSTRHALGTAIAPALRSKGYLGP